MAEVVIIICIVLVVTCVIVLAMASRKTESIMTANEQLSEQLQKAQADNNRLGCVVSEYDGLFLRFQALLHQGMVAELEEGPRCRPVQFAMLAVALREGREPIAKLESAEG